MTYLQPFHEAGFPTLVIDSGGQLRNVVRGSIGFDARDLPEVIDGVGGMARSTPNPQDEQPADAKEFEGMEGKFEKYFSSNPGTGD